MRCGITALILLSIATASAREVKDTVWTRENDRIILSYSVLTDGDRLTVEFNDRPRIFPSSGRMTDACNGEYGRLKVVLFDRIGDFGKVKWKGLSPTAFTVPAGFDYKDTPAGFYILGETLLPLEFQMNGNARPEIKFPLYVALYEKKQTYRILSSIREPLKVATVNKEKKGPAKSNVRTETERIAVSSRVETEADNEDITGALSSIEMVKELLLRETEVPFSQALQLEIYNLRSLRNKIKEAEVVDKINEVLLDYSAKEQELKEQQARAAMAALAEEQALMAQQKQEAEAEQKAAEEKARVQEEKQQKRTLWMIIGGAILAVLGFIGNAVFKHFRDLRNQQSIMQMQESLARQAEHEAGRRTREIVRNRAHQMVNKGRGKVRETMQGSANKQRKKTNRRSI